MKPTRTSKGEQGEGQSEDQRLDHDHAHGQEDGPFPGNPTLLGHNGQRPLRGHVERRLRRMGEIVRATRSGDHVLAAILRADRP